MTFSANLQRHINVSIEDMNHFDNAETDAAIAALPNYPETTASQIRAAAHAGDINAKLVIQRAMDGDEVAQEWV